MGAQEATSNQSQVTGHVDAELRRFGVEGAGAPLEVVSPFEPAGDQPQAIAKLAKGIEDGLRYQTSPRCYGFRQDLHHGQDD